MIFAQRLSRVKPSATLALNAKTAELKAQGINITSFALGEPDFNTPEHISLAAKKAIDEQKTKYTAVEGLPAARKAVCTYYEREYKAQIDATNTIITNGGKQSLYNIFMTLCSLGDEVIILAPYWTSYPEMVELAEATPLILHTTAKNNFKTCVEDLEKIATDKTKILLLNSPSNPTGAAYTQEELNKIAKWAIKKNIFVISDEIYDQLIYFKKEKVSLIHLFKKYPEHIAIVNGLAKTFSMTGWRLGYTVADAKLVKKMAILQSQATSNVCTIAQYALIEALTASYDCVHSMREAFEHRLELAYKEISSWEGVFCPKPEGAFYLFPDFSEYLAKRNKENTKETITADNLCEEFLEKAQVACVSGTAFGNKNCIRFSYALAEEEIIKALQRVYEVLYP